MEDATKPQYPVAFLVPTEDEKSFRPPECILCYSVPQPNSRVFLQDKGYTVLETSSPEYALITVSGEEEKWLVPRLTLKLIPLIPPT